MFAGNRKTYSSTRVMLVGCFTAALVSSVAGQITFIYFKQFSYIYATIVAWLTSAIILAIILAVREKDRASVINHGIDAAKEILDKK